ncbi:hypothetical protein pCXcHC2016_13 [Xenohaliotis phage pCXc-HC2016]|nr:hypothetical protein pCXcHC2016_13 [Xenohaliotis phage pCXc-HC2016]AQW89120.1 hypothetical protein pCXcHR2015_13 [Xenohaliotis phage pCXc-HR2015]
MPSLLEVGAGLSRSEICQQALTRMSSSGYVTRMYPQDGDQYGEQNQQLTACEMSFELIKNNLLQERNWSFFHCMLVMCSPELDQLLKDGTAYIYRPEFNSPDYNHWTSCRCKSDLYCYGGKLVITSLDNQVRLLPSYFVESLIYHLAQNASLSLSDLRKSDFLMQRAKMLLSKAKMTDLNSPCFSYYGEENGKYSAASTRRSYGQYY